MSVSTVFANGCDSLASAWHAMNASPRRESMSQLDDDGRTIASTRAIFESPRRFRLENGAMVRVTLPDAVWTRVGAGVWTKTAVGASIAPSAANELPTGTVHDGGDETIDRRKLHVCEIVPQSDDPVPMRWRALLDNDRVVRVETETTTGAISARAVTDISYDDSIRVVAPK